MGRTPELDAHLKRISQMARSGLERSDVQAILEPLTRAVTALDGSAPATTPTGHPRLSLAAPVTPEEPPAESPEVRDQRAQLLREKAEIEELLRQLDSRLEAITAFFTLEEQEHTTTRTDTERLSTLVLGEVKEIATDVGAASSLSELRGRIGSRLNSINSYIEDYRSHEKQRHTEHTTRTLALRVRVSELERESRALQSSLREEHRLALQDSLTGLPNRAAWDERYSREFERWERHGGVACLLVWDVDHFKNINDGYGHKAGDKMLRVLAQHLMRDLRTSDFVARYGGEEFVMLLPGLAANDALRIANRMRSSVQDLAFHFHDKPITVTISCGVTTFRMGDTPDSAFDRADRALYAAKDAGRNCCIVR